MKNKILYLIWGGLFILCALLGFIPQPEGFLYVLLLITGILFFVPGGLLLYNAYCNKDIATMAVIRNVSLISLSATLIFLVLNFLSANATKAAGDLLYGFLVIFSSPMVCSQNWLISLFLWACLLMTSISLQKQAKK
jgi:hypothetical protein